MGRDTGPMRVETVSDLSEFLAVTASWRAANPLTTNIISTIAMNAIAGARFVEHLDGWLVRDDDDAVLGAGLRADPYEFNVGPMPVEAARLLGDSIAMAGACPTEARGTENVVQAFAAGLGDGSRGAIVALPGTAGEGLYELGRLRVPDVAGAARRAVDADLELVTAWIIDFARDAGVVSHEPERRARNYVARGSMLLWEIDGRPVAMSGQAPLVDVGGTLVGRVGPVFTPSEHRRHGYGAAITAAASADFQASGARVMLFTDLSNPTSNAIYQRLGYEFAETIRHISFAVT